MEIYDAYFISARTAGNGGSDIVEICRSAAELSEKYRVRSDMLDSAKGGLCSEYELHRNINSSFCVIAAVPSDKVSEFMIPIVHTISRNKKLYVLIIDEKTHNVRTVVKADGYEAFNCGGRTSGADFSALLDDFISAARGEKRTKILV